MGSETLLTLALSPPYNLILSWLNHNLSSTPQSKLSTLMPSGPSYSSASYTRTSFGSLVASPISWRPGMLANGSRYFPGSFPSQCHSPLECVLYCSLFTSLVLIVRRVPLFSFVVPPTSAMPERYPHP